MNTIVRQLGLGLLLSFLGTLPSCREQLAPETSKLILNQTQELISFPSTASLKTIDVRSDSEEWVALCSSDWVRTIKKGKQLRIAVDANPTTELRQAVIQVTSGGKTVEIRLEQMGSPLEFTAQKETKFGQFGGERRFYVDASSPSWSVQSTAPWLEVTPYPLQGELSLKVAENTTREARSAQVHVQDRDGRVIHSLEVKQSPILYLVLPFDEFGANAEAVRFFETDRHSRLVNQPDFRANFTHWGYETVSPIFNYIIYTIKNGKYIGASVYATNRNPQHLMGSEGQEVTDLLVQKGYTKLEEGLYHNSQNNVEATIVTTSNNPNISFTAYPPQKPYESFPKLPLWLTNFYEVRFHPQEDDDPIIEIVSMGPNAEEIIAYEQSQGWRLIPPYDPTAPENAGDTPAEQERKRDERTRKEKHPLFFGAKHSNPQHWREFYRYLVFEKDGQYRSYEMGEVIEEYINTFIDPNDPLYGEKSRRVGDTSMTVTRQTFADPGKFFYWDNDTESLYVTREFRTLLARAGYIFSSVIDGGRAYIYFNPKTNLEIIFRLGKTLVDGDGKSSVVVMQVSRKVQK
ncbi:MAG: BACON domain-containing protein [Porphyromonadaceae bacterium]|nr:BACON domain-containing protein [Porphyromonadaceae bacterium]